MKAIHPAPILRFTLIADAVVSGAVALLQSLAPQFLAGLLALPDALLLGSGVFLLFYTVLLVALARSKTVWTALIALIVAGNLGWAVGCIALLAAGWAAPNALGVGFVLLQALTVLVFAGLEFAGLKASTPVAALRAARA